MSRHGEGVGGSRLWGWGHTQTDGQTGGWTGRLSTHGARQELDTAPTYGQGSAGPERGAPWSAARRGRGRDETLHLREHGASPPFLLRPTGTPSSGTASPMPAGPRGAGPCPPPGSEGRSGQGPAGLSARTREHGWDVRAGGTLPPMGAAKQQPTPTAQAAASISVFLASFCGWELGQGVLPPLSPPPSPCPSAHSPRRCPRRRRGSG